MNEKIRTIAELDRVNEKIRTIAELDRVIHEPGRLMVVALLFAVQQSDFLYLQHETGMNKGTLSSHMSRLEEAGYIEVTKTYRGKVPQTLLRLTPAGRKAFEQYRRQLKEAL
jgi:DNA-binding MarR family transcriptional regulator